MAADLPAPTLFDAPASDSLPETATEGTPYRLVHADSLAWLEIAACRLLPRRGDGPPYGLVEFQADQLEKRKAGSGGVWRVPPTFDGCQRSPLPRFTTLGDAERRELRTFFSRLSRQLMRVLVPGAHVFVATNPLGSYLVYEPFIASGFEKRGEVIRLVQTLRGGDRPKNAEAEFPMVSVIPRSCWEPWGLFRKPCEGRVQDNLRKWKTGGLRRLSSSEPFRDVIESSVARNGEREIAPTLRSSPSTSSGNW